MKRTCCTCLLHGHTSLQASCLAGVRCSRWWRALLQCEVQSSTLEEIICVTQPVLPDRYILDSSLLPVTPFTW